MAYKTDRQRVELVLLVQMMLAVTLEGVEKGEQDEPDFKECVEHLLAACHETISDLDERHRRKILDRMRRVHLEATKPYRNENDEVGRLGLIVFWLIKSTVDCGYIVYSEKSHVGKAMEIWLGALEHHANIAARMKSARKHAGKMLVFLQSQGYFHTVKLAVED